MCIRDSEYSINLPTKFWYRKKEWKGWINVVNPFRASKMCIRDRVCEHLVPLFIAYKHPFLHDMKKRMLVSLSLIHI